MRAIKMAFLLFVLTNELMLSELKKNLLLGLNSKSFDSCYLRGGKQTIAPNHHILILLALVVD